MFSSLYFFYALLSVIMQFNSTNRPLIIPDREVTLLWIVLSILFRLLLYGAVFGVLKEMNTQPGVIP